MCRTFWTMPTVQSYVWTKSHNLIKHEPFVRPLVTSKDIQLALTGIPEIAIVKAGSDVDAASAGVDIKIELFFYPGCSSVLPKLLFASFYFLVEKSICFFEFRWNIGDKIQFSGKLILRESYQKKTPFRSKRSSFGTSGTPKWASVSLFQEFRNESAIMTCRSRTQFQRECSARKFHQSCLSGEHFWFSSCGTGFGHYCRHRWREILEVTSNPINSRTSVESVPFSFFFTITPCIVLMPSSLFTKNG